MLDNAEPRAFSYERFSDPAKRQSGRSIERQNARRDGWLKRHPEVRFDDSLAFVDEGRSGYTGDHRTNPARALTAFLAKVAEGTVKPGDYLIIENLDRLTRENPIESIPFVCALIKSGIHIVQLVPWECEYHAGMDQSTLVGMLQELIRAHGESKRKSSLSGGNWSLKKEDARKGIPHGRAIPAWLSLVGGKYVLRPGAESELVKLFTLHAEGFGYVQLTREMNQSPASWVPGGRWTRGYVARTLGNRAVLGEHQPCNGSRKRVPDGPPIAGYFPPAVPLPLFNRALGARKARAGKSGRPGVKRGPTTPFSGLLVSALSGDKLRCRKQRNRDVFMGASEHEGLTGREQPTFPAQILATALLTHLRELEASDLFSDHAGTRVLELQGQIADLDARLSVALERFELDPKNATWADRVDKYDKLKRELSGQLDELEREQANPASASWRDAVRLMSANDPARLRQHLLATLSEVRCLFVKKGTERVAVCQVWFRSGETSRGYVVWTKFFTGPAGKGKPEAWLSFSERDAKLPALDLRDVAQAAAMRDVVQGADWTAFSRP